MRALVTGGAGFIGSHLVEALLEQGASVAVIDNFSTGRLENLEGVADRVDVDRLDLASSDPGPILEANNFDLIIHAAGSASIPASVADPRRDLEANILTTQNLLAAVLRVSPATAVVNISSAVVYDERSSGPMSEDHPRNPVSPYGVSKLAAEQYVTLYARLHGLRTCNVRVFSTFGPRLQKQVVWDFMKRLHANPGELVITGDGGERRNPTHVRNIVEALCVVAERGGMKGDVYNAGSRETISIAELARDIASAMGLSPEIRVTGEAHAGHVRTWEADITRLESLGYREKIGYRDGLIDTVRWFRSVQGAG